MCFPVNFTEHLRATASGLKKFIMGKKRKAANKVKKVKKLNSEKLKLRSPEHPQWLLPQ